MNQVRTSKRLFIPIGAAICFIVFLIHFSFIEKPIHDYRLTFSVTSVEYEQIVPELIDFKYDIEGEDFFISPNFESIADSLVINNIRRFELKIFTPNKITSEKCVEKYFNQLMISPSPLLVGSVYFGSSTPLQKSLGYLVLLLGFLLSIDFIFLRQRSGKQ